jgi:hypothetical protein
MANCHVVVWPEGRTKGREMSLTQGICKKIPIMITVVLLLLLGLTTYQLQAASAASASPRNSTDSSPAQNSILNYSMINLDEYGNYTQTAEPSPGISMTANGMPVNVQAYLSTNVARFGMSGPAHIVITNSAEVQSVEVRPLAYGISSEVAGDTISFTLDKPLKVAVDINGIDDDLVIFADPIEPSAPSPGQNNVVSVMSFPGVSNTGDLSTSGIQSAIDWVAAQPDHPTLYFPNGVYETATLHFMSHVHIYLASGAAILADPNIADYQQITANYADQTDVSALLLLRGVHDVQISGPGVINGNGYNIYTDHNGFTVKIVTIYSDEDSYDIDLSNVMFTNAVFYQSHFQDSHDITLTNVKFYDPQGNSPLHYNDDGFKVNSSYNVTYTDGWISSNDDNITVAACCGDAALQSTYNVHISDLVVDGRSASVRFAYTNPGLTVRDVSISDVYDIAPSRNEVFLISPSGAGYNYENDWGDIQLSNWDVEGWYAPLVDFDLDGNSTDVNISNIDISNIKMLGSGTNVIQGEPGMTFNNIKLDNVMIGGKMATSLASAYISTNQYASNVSVHATETYPENLAPGLFSSTTSIQSGESALTATDGNALDYIESGDHPSFPQYFTLRGPVDMAIDEVTYTCDFCQSQGLKNWEIQVSSDGETNWTTVASSGDVTWNDNDSTLESKSLSFPAVIGDAGIRVVINSAYTTTGQYRINQIEVNPAANLAESATASTTSIAPGYSVSTANDGNWATFFKGAMSPTFPQYLTLNWKHSRTFNDVVFVCDFCVGQGLTNWDIQVSADGSTNWTTVAESGNVTWMYFNGTREFKALTFPAAKVKGMRLLINNANLDFGQYQVDDIDVFNTST